jgi:uncharacterized protein
MSTSSPKLTLRVIEDISSIDGQQWDACAQRPRMDISTDGTEAEDYFNPFLSHAFLRALEQSGSATYKTGWQGAHLIASDDAGIIRAACPAYIKSHSMGEYVFDHAWADAWERAGGRYYPKIQSCIPFTPVNGRRLLVHPDLPRAYGEDVLLKGLRALNAQCDASSTHITFCTESEWQHAGQDGFLQRTGKQFHFINHGYADFDAFLAQLSSRKRKMIKRERKDALSNDISIEHISGDDIDQEHWDAFYTFYMDTGARKWGSPYLTRAFFALIGESMRDHIVLIMAKRAGRYIAGAINFIGGTRLYGRNWGCIEQHPFLHFEVCYYQAIDYALRHGLTRVEAGAQGEHKLMRGYEPVETYSVHHIDDERFAHAVAHYLAQERAQINAEIDLYAAHLPFKKP